jgi:hypothetical protein
MMKICCTAAVISTATQPTMSTASLQLEMGLEDLLGDLRYARRSGDLGRLALLAYCEVRRWARLAGQQRLAQHSAELITHCPHSSREEFLAQVDELIIELEEARPRHSRSESTGTQSVSCST